MLESQAWTRVARLRAILLFTLFLAVLLLVLLPIIWRMVITTDRPVGPFQCFDVIELGHLGQAIEFYGQRYGEYPPPPDRGRVIDHARRVYRKVVDPGSVLTSAGLDLDRLDSRESLVFWLSGRASELFLGWPECSHPFDSKRLVDADEDGWLEYTTRDGDPLTTVSGNVAIESRKLGRRMTLEQIHREYTGR